MSEIFDPADHPNTAVSASVISLAEVRLSRGWSRGGSCEHRDLVYSIQDRAIRCKSCEKPIDGFDGFMVLARNFQTMVDDAKRQIAKAEAGAKAVLVRRAAKALDKAWGQRMAPCCPHCNGGLLAPDFAEGARSAVSEEWELARRRSKGLKASQERLPPASPKLEG